MTSTQIYQLYIRAEVEAVFQALLDPDFTRSYFHGTAFTDPPRAGQPYALSTPDGTPAERRSALSGGIVIARRGDIRAQFRAPAGADADRAARL